MTIFGRTCIWAPSYRYSISKHLSAGSKSIVHVLKPTPLTSPTKNPHSPEIPSFYSVAQGSLNPKLYVASTFPAEPYFSVKKSIKSIAYQPRTRNHSASNVRTKAVNAEASSFHRQSSNSKPTQESNFGSWFAAVAVIVVVVTYSASSGVGPASIESTEFAKSVSNMTGEALPGRPGTLTPEQEEKLREFWVAVLQVFGVLEAKDLHGDSLAGVPNGKDKSETTSSKPKKKRFSMLRRGGKDDDTDSVTSASETDDKYGQTKEFHEALASMSPESLRNTFWSMVKHDHPDDLLLRFLRARKWDVEKALIMMVSTMRWRSTDVHVDDDIVKNGELAALEDEKGTDPEKKKQANGFLAQMRMGKSYLHGTDKEGRPMCFVRARLHKQGEQTEESLEKYTVFLIESARMVLAPPVDTACVVFDMTGFSMANMDYAPVKFMIKCFEANYPESLGVVLVHKAPWIFQGIWKIIRGWLDPVVASKVNFTKNMEEMEEFVERSHIISELGGGEDWTYEYIEPVPGENDKMKDVATRDQLLQGREVLVKDYEKATVAWIHAGSADSTATKSQRNQIASSLREDYWRLDPYIRARSYYDRVGLIQPGGRMQFYPSQAGTSGAAANQGTSKPIETSDADLD